MRRLCTESSWSYSGRSARRAIGGSHGSRTEGHAERRGTTTVPYHRSSVARRAATRGVIGQKSAEAIVATPVRKPDRRRAEHE
jgi:hypothetical protein